MWLVLLLATSLRAPHTLAATTYNLPLLQETLEVIGGDIFMGINNILNGGGGLKGMVQDKDSGNDVMDDEDQLEDTDVEVEETETEEGEENLPAEEKTTPDTPGVETNTVAPNAAESDSTVVDDQNDEEDEDEESPTEEEKTDENKIQKDSKSDDDTKPEVDGETKANEQPIPAVEGGSDDVEAHEVSSKISNFLEDEEEDDDAKNLASAFVNIAAQKIREKLEDLQI